MNAALLVTLCLAADAPVSAPLPASNGTPTRVLRDDEKGGKRATVSATAAAIAAQAATAPSTNRKRPSSGCLFEVEDLAPREYAVHDLVTIIVAESSRSKSVADSRADKDNSVEAEIAAFMTLDPTSLAGGPVQMDPDSLPVFDMSGSKRFRGRGNFNRSDDFTARVTAEIVDIKPNGLLVLEARREIVNDGESQVIVLSGLCRPEDVDANNQVTSQRIADAIIKKTTTGQLRDTTEKGILAKLIDTIFAF